LATLPPGKNGQRGRDLYIQRTYLVQFDPVIAISFSASVTELSFFEHHGRSTRQEAGFPDVSDLTPRQIQKVIAHFQKVIGQNRTA
jgi:hypothetical protein